MSIVNVFDSAGAVLALVIVRSLWIPRASAALIPAQASHGKEKKSVNSVDSFRFAKKKKGKQKVLSLQKVNQRREVNYCGI